MFYLFFGNDIQRVREAAHTKLGTLRKEYPQAYVEAVDADVIEETNLEEVVFRQDLFGQRHITLLDNVLSGSTNPKEIVTGLAESAGIFVVLEEKIPAKLAPLLKKQATETKEFKKPTKDPGAFNVFALTDAFGARNKKQFWVLLEQARIAQVPAEQLHGLLWWQVKNMLLATQYSSAKEAGLSPFVYTKAKKAAEKYSREELERISETLVWGYHDARRTGGDVGVFLEQLALRT